LITLILQSSQNPVLGTQLLERQAAMTPALALASGEQLSRLRQRDKPALLKALSLLITQLGNSFNVGKNVDTLQVYECATLLAEKYWYLRLEEFVYVFKQARLGKYGKVYDRLDVQVISEWLSTYDTGERLAEMERRRQVQLEQEMDSKLSAEELHRCYQKLKGGEKLDVLPPVEQAASESSRGELEYYRFKMEYARQRRVASEEAGNPEGS
jgi:hypothetical protein